MPDSVRVEKPESFSLAPAPLYVVGLLKSPRRLRTNTQHFSIFLVLAAFACPSIASAFRPQVIVAYCWEFSFYIVKQVIIKREVSRVGVVRF